MIVNITSKNTAAAVNWTTYTHCNRSDNIGTNVFNSQVGFELFYKVKMFSHYKFYKLIIVSRFLFTNILYADIYINYHIPY